MASTTHDRRPGRDPAGRVHDRARAAVPRDRRSSTTGRRAILRPLVRHGRAVCFIGGMLVVAIGLAMIFDWLSLLPQYFQFNTAV